ncbi:MAG TPA: DUF2203 family protein [Thermoanaerobaculia bacterium]|nr:DUF2203 family protein [Thermoanaerobaculia bacterium]
MSKKIFSYEDAIALLPAVQQITNDAVARLEDVAEHEIEVQQRIISDWAETIMGLGIDVKGLWLVDFDNGAGYYCWRYPEPALEHFHGYEEGFQGRVKLN